MKRNKRNETRRPSTAEILGSRVAEQVKAGKARIFGLRLLSLFGGAASLIAVGTRDVLANDPAGTALRPQPPQNTGRFKPASIAGGSSKPALLRRQSEFRLPIREKDYNMMASDAVADNCPGIIVPPGNYTSAAPYTASGNTNGANDTVSNYGGGYYYSYSQGPDHVYTFTVTAIGSNPSIEVTPTPGLIYLKNGLTNGRCPSGTSNFILAENVSYNGVMSLEGLPLNVPHHLFVDSFTPSQTLSYTLKIQNATIGETIVPPENDAPLDMNGDGRSDFVVTRNTGGGPGGQLTWFTRTSSGQFQHPVNWGIDGDIPVTADVDGDGRDDLIIWRPGPQGRFYIVRSRDQTIHIEDFGQTGDDPTVIGDYTQDGVADLTVYRPGAAPGAQSYWFYRSLADPAGQFQAVAWGLHGDRPIQGRFDEYGGPTLAVQRPEGGDGRFYFRSFWGDMYTRQFGLADDLLAPGDYDGDGIMDLAVVRPNQFGQLVWYFRPSNFPSIPFISRVWGVAATDTIVQADYTGDGRTDLAIWRPGSPGRFFIMDWNTGNIDVISWGHEGDTPVAGMYSK